MDFNIKGIPKSGWIALVIAVIFGAGVLIIQPEFNDETVKIITVVILAGLAYGFLYATGVIKKVFGKK